MPSSQPLVHGTDAEVRANHRVIRYSRFGAGRASMLLLCPDEGRAALRAGLLEALSPDHRILVPESDGNDGEVACRLADFLEGLGVSSVRVVACDPMDGAALQLTSCDPDRIDRVAVVSKAGDLPGRPAGTALGFRTSALGVGTDRGGPPVLVLGLSLPSAEIVRLVSDFMRSDPP